MKRYFNIGIMFAWAAAVVSGMIILLNYQSAPGEIQPIPAIRPESSMIQPAGDLYTLIMIAHPQCPCTRASLGELARLMSKLDGRLEAHVLFFKPSATFEEVKASDLWGTASDIPHVTPRHDADGSEIARLGGTVSGQVVLYDPDDRLVYRGGITAARGHEGGNVGTTTIVKRVRGEATDVERTPVFGCAMSNIAVTAPAGEPEWN